MKKALYYLLYSLVELLSSTKVKFLIVGGSVAVGGALMLFLLVKIGLSPEVANPIQAITSIVANFLLNNFWTWRHRQNHTFATKAGRFAVAKVITLLLNQFFFVLMHTIGGIPYMVTYFVNLALLTLVNYILNENFVFREEDEDASEI